MHRAGAEDLADCPPHPDPEIAAALGDKPAHLTDVGAALGAEARVLGEIEGRQILNDADRERLMLALRRIAAVARLLDDGRR